MGDNFKLKKMKPLLLLFSIAFLLVTPCNLFASEETTSSLPYGKKKVEIGVSENDAEIFVNGKLIGKGSTEITVPKDDCVTVVVKKVAYLTERIEFCNKKDMSKPPKSYYVEMKRDDSFDASIQTDIANIDIELKCNTMSKDKAWKLINQIVLTYIDVIEMTDKETGYLRTSWSLKTFMQNTVRTRIIIKESSSDPLIFKVKLISESSGMSMTSVKSDELYKEWDRVLRSYSDVISEFQARVK